MLRRSLTRPSVRALWCGVAALTLGAAPALAQDAPPAPSDSAMVNLVRLLVEQGVLAPEKGEALMRQAQAEADQARAAQVASTSAPQVASSQLPPPAAGTVRVPYIPETVRTQIKEELRAEVLAEAKKGGWAAPELAAPAWVHDVRLTGDLRFRSQSALYAKNNSNLILDVARFNASGPFDLNAPSTIVPTINSTQDRLNQLQIRARLGLEASLGSNISVGFQLASGDDNGPVSTNATLGGGFGKRDIWLQLAYLKGDFGAGISGEVGRFENPFLSTDLLFDPDLAFDGAAAEVDFGKMFNTDYTLALRGGAFPLDFGDPDYPSTSFDKRSFPQRYLFSAQFEAGRAFDSGLEFRAAAGYHVFTNLQGKLSEPCDIYSNPSIECSTDALRPLFPAKGNTVFFLRTFDTTANPDPANPQEPQFVGLKFDYRILDLNASVSVPIADGVTATLSGNYVRNLGFKRGDICGAGIAGQPLNNVSAGSAGVCGTTNAGSFTGGDQGYGAFFSIGHKDVFEKGHWSVFGGYKYLESDAVLDSFTDSDFHLGGTNAKGYYVGAGYGLFDHVKIGARWLSANEIVDQPLSIDVLLIDLEGSF